MPHLRLALAAGGLLLAVPALASCGFDYPTERVNTIGAGVSVRDADVDVTGTLIVAGQSDSGTLIGGLSNNVEEAVTLIEIAGGEKGAIAPDEFEPVEIAPNGHVNLASLAEADEGITVSGDFEAGDFVTITFTFDNDQSVTTEIPVMKACYEFEGLDNTSEEPSDEPLYSCEPPEAELPEEH
jgi:copper(I)-binding protein